MVIVFFVLIMFLKGVKFLYENYFFILKSMKISFLVFVSFFILGIVVLYKRGNIYSRNS